ncbi:MAG: hypothetical protein RBR47_05250, partial [Bacteroidales bacterium]|nr:hypothetical protein [Bacteroidales bacterium]
FYPTAETQRLLKKIFLLSFLCASAPLRFILFYPTAETQRLLKRSFLLPFLCASTPLRFVLYLFHR